MSEMAYIKPVKAIILIALLICRLALLCS